MRSILAAPVLAALVLAALAVPASAAAGSPALTNSSGKTIVRRLAAGNDMSMVIVSSKGTSVFLDPRGTQVVPDAFVFTHDHHLDKAFVAVAKDAKSLISTPGTLTVKDVKVTGFASSHSESPIQAPPEYVFFLVEVDGLKIVYVPCTRMTTFTREQLAALGTVDVAMIDAETESDGRRAKRAYALAKTVHPRVILTLSHHVSDYELALDEIADEGGKVETLNDPLVLDPAKLEGAPERVINLLATAG